MAWWGQARRDEREAWLKALEAMKELAVTQAKAVERQSEFLLRYLDTFKWEGQPEARAFTDFDELRLERERLEAEGFPVHGTAQEQAGWVAVQMDMRPESFREN